MQEVVKSVYFDQDTILDAIQTLYCPDGFECDITYGKGGFYKNRPRPSKCFDIQPMDVCVTKADSACLPLSKHGVSNLIFDPPFLTYIRDARKGNGSMVMSNQFGGYWKYEELETHYKDTLKESARVLCYRGIMVFKCQDIIHNHKMHCTHANVIQWASEVALRLVDLFVLVAKHRMPSPNRKGRQKHARIFHSYFLVLENTNKQ